jgi:hypothetical protein
MGLAEVVPQYDPKQQPPRQHQSRKQWMYPGVVLCICREDKGGSAVEERALLTEGTVVVYQASRLVQDQEDRRVDACWG